MHSILHYLDVSSMNNADHTNQLVAVSSSALYSENAQLEVAANSFTVLDDGACSYQPSVRAEVDLLNQFIIIGYVHIFFHCKHSPSGKITIILAKF